MNIVFYLLFSSLAFIFIYTEDKSYVYFIFFMEYIIMEYLFY